jgi:formate transporter FocA
MNQVPVPFDSLMPAEMAEKAESSGVTKAHLPAMKMFALAVLAGAFIALGAAFSTTATAGLGDVPFGVVKLIAGVTFCLGLVLVVVAGAELFTGNNLIVMAWAARQVSTMKLLRNWGVVYVGNLVGSIATAALVFVSGHHAHGAGAVGQNALAIASAKTQLGFTQAIALGVLCNALVCLAIWLCMSARSTTDRVLAIIFPITAFVAAGFEHSVANMYFIPSGLFIKSGASDGFWASASTTAADYSTLNWQSFFVDNLLPVTIGNIIGGSLMVGIVYWFIYLRGPASER